MKKHITIDRHAIHEVVAAKGDRKALSDWLTAHEIDIAWVKLDQTLEFSPGHVWYDQYRHNKKGVLELEKDIVSPARYSTVPIVDRVHHKCTPVCKDTADPFLTYFAIEETDEPAPAAKPRRGKTSPDSL